MKYPITPEYLESAPDSLVELYTDLEEKILQDICRRFKLSGEVTESAIAQIKILQERGMPMENLEAFIKNTLKMSNEELDKIIDRAVERNQEYYDELISKQDILHAPFRGIGREVDVINRQTHGALVNLTQSMGFAIRVGQTVEFLPIAEAYQKVLDDASAQVLSGAVDYNTSIKEAVKRLTDSGLQMVDYASGWHNRVDVAVRRAVMTGVSQLSSQYSEQAAEELETDLREVTAHAGARDTGDGWKNHKSWQGKVYSVKSGDKYPSIYTVCGWGMVDGLEGANCRHHHYPFVEGVSERTYTDEQLANIDPPPFEYQGKKYTAYEATQKQRQIERAMRKSKREFIGYEAAGQTEAAQDSAIRLRRLSQEYNSFSKASGLRTQPERAQTAGFGRGEAARAKAAYDKEIKRLNAVKKGGIIIKTSDIRGFDGYTAEQYTEMLSRRAIVTISETVTSLPLDSQANSVTDLLDPNGQVKQRRIYGPMGKASIDYDTDDHNKPKYHPTGAHKHFYNHKNKNPHGKPNPLTESDLSLNGDIIKEGDNYHAPKIEKPD